MAIKTKAVKVRTLNITSPFANGKGTVALNVGNDRTHYHVEALASNWGKAVRWTKFALEGTYNVLLVNEQDATCECRGHARWGTACKHISATRKMVEMQLV